MHFSAAGSRPASSAARARRRHDPLDDVRVGELDDHAVALAARDRERLRPVAGDVHLDLGQLGPDPLQLQLLVVPVDGLAVHERLDHLQRRLELRDLDRLAADVAHSGVAAPDAHDHPAVGDVVQRRVGAREHRRFARARVRDHVAELDRRGAVCDEREHRERLLPEHMRVVRPGVLEAVLLGELDQLDHPAVGRVGQHRDAEAQGHAGEPTHSGSVCAGRAKRPRRGPLGHVRTRHVRGLTPPFAAQDASAADRFPRSRSTMRSDRLRETWPGSDPARSVPRAPAAVR